MKRLIPYFLTALVCFGIGFYSGGYHYSLKYINQGTIISTMWFSSIHRALEKGKPDVALSLTENALTSHIGTLDQASKSPQLVLFFMLPWINDPLSEYTEEVLERTANYFATKPEKLTPEARIYLTQFQTEK